MSSDARRKHRRELKRREKRLALRRQEGLNPYHAFKSDGELVACYINRGWRENGVASILVLKRVPADRYILCAFLVDLWCLGLKDAWGRIDVTPGELEERLTSQTEVVRVEPELVRRLVAGGIRFARQNSFRLPRRYERWVEILGGVGDPGQADLSDFGTEDGKLRYVGPIEDLRSRLLVSPEQFFSRPDVEFITDVDPHPDLIPVEPEEEAPPGPVPVDALEPQSPPAGPSADAAGTVTQEQWETLRRTTLAHIRRWCFAGGIQPSPMLGRAIDTYMMMVYLHVAYGTDDSQELDVLAAAAQDLNPRDKADFVEAMNQIRGFLDAGSPSG